MDTLSLKVKCVISALLAASDKSAVHLLTSIKYNDPHKKTLTFT